MLPIEAAIDTGINDERTQRGWASRALALAFTVGVLFYPAKAFVLLPSLPLGLRLAWPGAVLTALLAPRASLLAFVAAAPLLEAVPSHVGWTRVSLGEMWLLALLVGAWLEMVAGKRKVDAKAPPWLPLLVAAATASMLTVMYPFYLAAGGLGALLADIHEFLEGTYILVRGPGHVYTALITWMMFWEGLGLLWLVISRGAVEPDRWIRRVLVASAAGCVAVVGYGFFVAAGSSVPIYEWVHLDARAYRIQSTFADSIALGSYYALMLWVFVGLARSARSPGRRLVLGAGVAAVALGIFFTVSRAAWFTTLAAGTVYALALLRFRMVAANRWLARHRRLVVSGVGAALVVAAVVLSSYATRRDVHFNTAKGYGQFVLGTFNLSAPDQEILKYRAEYWKAALRMVVAHPIFGIGIGRFYNDLYRYAPEPETLLEVREHAHNYYLQLAAELGLFGLFLFLALLASALRATHRVLRSDTGPSDRHLALGLAVAICAFATTQLTGHALLLREAQHTFWPVVASALLLPAATSAVAAPAGRRRGGWLRRSRPLVPVVVVLLLASAVPRGCRGAASVDRLKVFVGFNEVQREPSGYEFRWLAAHAVFFVPGDAKLLEIPLRSLAPFAQQVEVVVDDRRVDVLTLADHQWHQARYQLPSATQSGFRKVELNTDRTWQPPGQPQPRGVMIGETKWVRSGPPA